MRVLLDLQPGQTHASASRGVGRYSMALAAAMIRRAPQHEFWVILNERFPEAALAVRSELEDLLAPERILTFSVPDRISPASGTSDWRRNAAALIREAAIRQIEPDHVHVFSLFEGLGEDAIVTVGESRDAIPTSVTLYDLIPLVRPDLYLGAETVRRWYHRQLRSLMRADLLLAISEASRRDAIDRLHLEEDAVVTVSSAVSAAFQPVQIPPADAEDLRKRYGLGERFVLYGGGIDPRKNVEGLIEAFSRLPLDLRRDRQLVIVCSVEPHTRIRLLAQGADLGIPPGNLVLTGFVPDADLIAIYNLCELFVFPSLYEGFGLPVLEAMACGAPVIGSNNSSIPEVIGDPDALFDPSDPDSLALKIAEVLSNPERLQDMARRALRRSSLFTWDAVADRAVAAIEKLHSGGIGHQRTAMGARKLRLAYISPLPPLQTGIASYSRALVPELARYFDVDLITVQDRVADALLLDVFPIRDVSYFEAHYGSYDRVLYNFGNSDFHRYMFDLLAKRPGLVILHDLFLSGIKHWIGKDEPGCFEQALVEAHGYQALVDNLRNPGDDAIWKYPCNGDVIANATGIIVHSEYSRAALIESGVPEREIARIRHLSVPVIVQRDAARIDLGFEPDDFVVCAFGNIGPTKLNHLTVEAFLQWTGPGRRRLIFVGPAPEGAYLDELRALAAKSRWPVVITGSVDDAHYGRYLAAADVAVQLRTKSRGETSGTIVDCLAHGLPVIISAEGPATEYPDDCVVKLPRDASASLIAGAMRDLQRDPVRRRRLAEAGPRLLRKEHHPSMIGRQFRDAIEELPGRSRVGRLQQLLADLRSLATAPPEPLGSKADAVRAAVLNLQPSPQSRLLIDVSEIVRRDWKSGIQRVVRNVLGEFLRDPRLPVRVVPIYADASEGWRGFRHARRFAEEVLGIGGRELLGEEEVIEIGRDDVFLGLDLYPNGIADYVDSGLFAVLRARGAHILFVVYDLIPITHPEFFPPGARDGHMRWIRAAAQVSDALLCISRAVADDVVRLLDAELPAGAMRPHVRHFPLGCEIGAAVAAARSSPVSKPALEQPPNILMVGTIEPRKGHAAVLEAFDHLWSRGRPYRLTIVGKTGWIANDIVDRLRNHPEVGQRLVWHSAASDEELAQIYGASSGLLAASYTEGFGLPIVEAGFLGLPVLARDIPVFREVAGDHAKFFSGDGPALVEAVDQWAGSLAAGLAKSSGRITLTSWAESADRLASLISEEMRMGEPREERNQALAKPVPFPATGRRVKSH